MSLPASPPLLDLSIQYKAPHSELSKEQLQLWVETALAEAMAVYTEESLPLPFRKAIFVLRFCDEKEAKALNHQYRQKNYATNVLTFEYGIDEQGSLSSDIIICTAVLEKEASEQQKPFLHHAAHLCVHGVLHALGYDHITEDDAQDMESLEADILQLLHIPNPYN